MSEKSAVELFSATWGAEPAWIGVGPGRINLIGEHTDYSDGFVFPAAIDREVWVAAGPSPSGLTELVSRELGPGGPFSHKDLDPARPISSWSKYPAAVAWALGAKTPIRAAVASTLPPESGVSSSAAIELAFGCIWNLIDGLGYSNKDLALIGQKAENQYVGVPCGVMDQMASAMGRAGHALFLDTRTLEIDYAPVPDGVSIVLCDTGRRRQLAGGEYKERREQCESAAAKLGVPKLRDASLEDLDMASLLPVEERRAFHVVQENQRCLDFAHALAERDLALIGQIMEEGHNSLRLNFEVSVRELNVMAGLSRRHPGCIGARLTGAGFGGAVVALVHSAQVEDFVEKVADDYEKACPGYSARLMACVASEGARASAR